MRTGEEVLAYATEQMYDIELQAKEKGLKLAPLTKIRINLSKDSLEQRYELYKALMWFVTGEI